MSQPLIAQVALPTPLKRLFDYLVPPDMHLVPGMRVQVSFGKRELVGVVVALSNEKSTHADLKSIAACLDAQAIISNELLNLCQKVAAYYHYAAGDLIVSALPTYLRQAKSAAYKLPECEAIGLETPLTLNAEQAQAVQGIKAQLNQFQTYLINGVTGSGKTEVYLSLIALVLAQAKQALILVPEINLTPQTIARFSARFQAPIVTLHSGLAAKKRAAHWLAASDGTAKIIIGTQSAVLTSFYNLGIIIIDEEHDASFKQQDRARFHARDVAIMRAQQLNIPIVLGSATPSLETLRNVQKKRYIEFKLSARAANAVLPKISLIDMRACKKIGGLSEQLLQTMRTCLADKQQVMLFINRRGYAPVFYCMDCGAMAHCKRCDLPYVYHAQPKHLQCHHCDSRRSVLQRCDHCQSIDLLPVGLGTQKIEETLQQLFPQTPIVRLDRDSTRKKGALEQQLNEIHTHNACILVGTQMLAKGHHFPKVTLVAVIDADSGLYSADFRATEKLAQLIVQVSGRAGRAKQMGQVYIQTLQPNHPFWQHLLPQGYDAYAKQLLAEREQTGLPPYCHLATIKAEAHQLETAKQFLQQIKHSATGTTVKIIGPAACAKQKKKGFYTQQLMLMSSSRQNLQQTLTLIETQIDMLPEKNRVKWHIDVDALETL